MIKDEKISKEEREMMNSMSEIEKKIVAQAKAKVEKKKAQEKKESQQWWSYDNPNIYFTVSTNNRYTFEPDEQIFTSYGRRSNKFLMVFYGFCISDNKHDSVMMRINKKLKDDDRWSIDKVINSLVLLNQ